MKVKGIAYWASIQSPNMRFTPQYQIDLAISDKSAETLKDLGAKIKDKDYGKVVAFKRKVTKKDETPAEKPYLIDKDGNPLNSLIGNGSEVIVEFGRYEWSNTFGSGIGFDLRGVQVLELVPYNEEDDTIIGEDDPSPKKPKTNNDFDDDLPDVL